MDTQKIKRSLREELRKSENQELFELARRRNKAFANYSNPFSILAALDNRSTTSYTEKDSLTRSIISEQQRAPNSLWSSILIAAYLPMLSCLRNRITGNPLSPDELDQIVVATFLQVVDEFPLSKWRDYTCVRLRQQTQRRVFRELNQERLNRDLRDWRSLEEIPENDLDDSSIWQLSRSDKCDSPDIEPVVALLLERVGDAIDHGKLDLVIATTIRGENLRDFIKRRRFTSLDSQGNQEYQRLKRQRSRTLAKVRKILKKRLSPIEEDEAL